MEFTPEEYELLEAWREANPWFDHDEELRGAAIALENAHLARGKLGLRDRLQKIQMEVRRFFPEKFFAPDDNLGILKCLDAHERRGLEEIQRLDPKMTPMKYLKGAANRDYRELLKEHF